jgi:hypothetical protein
MTDVFKTILFFLFIWWVLQFLSKLVATVPASNKKTNSGFNPFQQEFKKKEGGTTIHYKNKANIKKPNSEGAEYVDYEEVN